MAPIGLAGAAGGASPPNADPWPARVSAVYKITFNGFEIGSFRFETKIGPKTYTVDGHAEISAMLGAFKWQGITRATGAVEGDAPHPNGYNFAYNSSARSGTVRLAFNRDNVTSVAMVPPIPGSEEEVPVKDQHLKSVLDPLSAVLAMSRGSEGQPCARKLSIFDGKQRFDLVMTSRGEKRIRVAGSEASAILCQVRYVPIAGHRAGEETRNPAAQTGAEVALLPLPGANIFLPHQITIPTGMGPAVLSAQRIDIQTIEHGQIALTE